MIAGAALDQRCAGAPMAHRLIALWPGFVWVRPGHDLNVAGGFERLAASVLRQAGAYTACNAAIMRAVKFARPPLVPTERPTLALGGNTALEERPDCNGQRRS